MKYSNLIDSMVCKYPSILTGLLVAAASVFPLATPATAAPTLTVTNGSMTGSIPVGSAAIYNITISNTSTEKAYNVKITDILPSGFKYDGELSIVTAGSVSSSAGKNYVKPAVNDTTLVWDNYDIPGNGSISIFFTANTNLAAAQLHSTSVDVAYSSTAGGASTLTARYDGTPSSATDDDVTLKPVPPTPDLVAAFPSSTNAFSCAQPGLDGAVGNLGGIINTYFRPALQSVAAGATSIDIMPVAAQGAGNDIKPGDLVLVVQMQDATINGSNDDLYGSGDATNQGSGQSSMGKTGLYEYAIASSTVSATTGGTKLTIKTPLINSYTSSAFAGYTAARASVPATLGSPERLASPEIPYRAAVTYRAARANPYRAERLASPEIPYRAAVTYRAAIPATPEIPATPATAASGQKRFQVVRVPQYASVNLTSTLLVSPWDGNVGGVLAIDTSGKFDFKGQAISVNNSGFRGGYGVKNSYQNAIDGYMSPTNSTFGAGKGEGTAGTPRYIWNGTLVNNGAEGYPGGDTGRGAPANAGGGGNFHNAGGGGGGNGGVGGQGGLPWVGTPAGNKDAGGRPGFPSSTSTPVPWKLIMGGGGGGGEANNALTAVRGGVGGGIVMLRAGTMVGSGTIFANGENGDRGVYDGAPDGAGGGGAGGTVLIQSRNATSANITIQAKGGLGGSTVNDNFNPHTPHGPGGGGSGGVVWYNAPGVTVNATVTGGASGHTADDLSKLNGMGTSSTPHGATAGSIGIATAFTGGSDPFTDLNNTTTCAPALVLTTTTTTPKVKKGEMAKYKITVTNSASNGTAANIEIKDVLPRGFAYSKTDSISLNKGSAPATQPVPSNPTAQATTPVWGKFTIPPGGVVEIEFQAEVTRYAVDGTYKSPSSASYPNPASQSLADTYISVPDNSSTSTSGDVTVRTPPAEMVWNVSPTIRIVRK